MQNTTPMKSNSAIDKWNEERQTDGATVTGYLKQGFFFEVLRDDYNAWSEYDTHSDSCFIRAHLGVTNGKLEFYLSPPSTDKKLSSEEDSLLLKPLLNGFHQLSSASSYKKNNFSYTSNLTDVNISREEALYRSFLWQAYFEQWVTDVFSSKSGQIFHTMKIPFESYRSIFDNNNTFSVINFFGLTLVEDYFQPEIVVVPTIDLPQFNLATNHSIPVPPFDPNDPPENTTIDLS